MDLFYAGGPEPLRGHRITRTCTAHTLNGYRCRPASVVEVWCDVPAHVARNRYAARQRHRIHDDPRQLVEAWPRWEAQAEPLGVAPVVRVDTHGVVDLIDVADRIAKT